MAMVSKPKIRKLTPKLTPKMAFMTTKTKFFDFGLEQKLDRHSCVEFHSDSDGDGFNFPKVQLNPPKCPLATPKMKFFNFGLEQKLDQHTCVEFRGESNNDSFKVHTVKSIIIKAP